MNMNNHSYAEADQRTLWIGDIQPNWNEEYIQSIFQSFGMETPIVRLKADKVTGSLYGYGFLEFTSPQNATTALENLNGAMIPGTAHRIRLNWGSGPGSVKRMEEDVSVFVGDLAFEVTDEMLREAFVTSFPTLRGAKVVMDPTTGKSKGYGFVRLSSQADADRALQTMNGASCMNRVMRVCPATEKRPKFQYAAQYQQMYQQHPQYQQYHPQQQPVQYSPQHQGYGMTGYQHHQQPPNPAAGYPMYNSNTPHGQQSYPPTNENFTHPQDVVGMNQHYLATHQHQYYPPMMNASYMNLAQDPTQGTAMAFYNQ